MAITIYSTPTLQLRAKGIDLTSADSILVTFSDYNGSELLTKDNATAALDGEDTIVTVTLSQAETALFRPKFPSKGQINAMFGNTRLASRVFELDVLDNLKKEILE